MLFIAVSISESDHKKALVKPTFDAKIVHGSGRCKSGSVQGAAATWRLQEERSGGARSPPLPVPNRVL